MIIDSISEKEVEIFTPTESVYVHTYIISERSIKHEAL